MLVDYIVRPMMLYSQDGKATLNAQSALDSVVMADDCKIGSDDSMLLAFLLEGMTVILFSNDKNYLVANLKQVEKKDIRDPELTYNIRAPKDCFTENLDVNISLIRYRIKDPKLKFMRFEVGARTKARIVVLYIEDIVNMQYVNDIANRINKINVDGIVESGVLQSSLLNSPFNLFPQWG